MWTGIVSCSNGYLKYNSINLNLTLTGFVQCPRKYGLTSFKQKGQYEKHKLLHYCLFA